MSNAKAENQDAASNAATGRMTSRARRQALSVRGKTGAGQAVRATNSVMSPRSVRVETVVPAVANTVLESGSEDDCGCTHETTAQTLDAVCAIVEAEPSSSPSVRQLCQERRRALSSKGKPVKGKLARNIAATRRTGANKGGAPDGLSGRAAAQARREDLCRNGRGDDPACRPTGRVRSLPAAPAKVEEGNTLRGNLITGTQVERSSKVTGIESGSCRSITGTEYIGAEQYDNLCAATPAAAPAKVGSGSTSRGQRVSGTEVGRSVLVTGDESGTCKNITGNEYISSEQLESFCASKPAASPAKVGLSATSAGQRVSGTEVGRSAKVTGDEPGACLKLTGSQYYQPDQSGSICKGSGVPHKVSVMNTGHGRPVSGTDVAASAVVTGSEYGSCANVTGSEYAGLQQYQACNREPVLTPEKVTVMRTFRDQSVSGTSVEHNPKVTGDEFGACQPISGTEYIGSGQYSKFCATDRLAAARERVATQHGAAGASMTGAGKFAEHKVTGSARGAAQYLSGTPYSDNAKPVLSGAVGMSQHPLTRGLADRSQIAVASAAPLVQGNFSVISPARAAQESQLSRVTGTSYGAQGRITGPVNLATGLVSGTPEFRYKEDQAGTVATSASTEQSSRLTGEGREAGFAITGAAWRRGESTTGTEGTSATRRNPTLRGDQRSMGAQAAAIAMKQREHPQVPPSKVTGSSGNAAAGSTITYSGGARG